MGNDEPLLGELLVHTIDCNEISISSDRDSISIKIIGVSSFILFCKSFRDDVLRAKRLLESIAVFNQDHIPFYLSVPSADLNLFHATIDFKALNEKNRGAFYCITDEEVVAAMPNSTLTDYQQMRGYCSQQVVKSEAWRLLGCEHYLCLDSDAFFTQNFYLSYFLHPDGNPYSLMHDAHELLDLAKTMGKNEVIESFLKDSRQLKQEFSREGPDYDFGPPPMIWSAKVWDSLYTQHLEPKSERFWDAIERIPLEIRWYGEALLKFKAIPIHPITPLFVFYHYEWQYQFAKQQGNAIPTNEKILGVVMQSYWDESLRPTFARKGFLSRTWKRIKQSL